MSAFKYRFENILGVDRGFLGLQQGRTCMGEGGEEDAGATGVRGQVGGDVLQCMDGAPQLGFLAAWLHFWKMHKKKKRVSGECVRPAIYDAQTIHTKTCTYSQALV